MSAPYTALDIANDFVKTYKNTKDDFGIKLSPLKLQKLLYYAFGTYYAIKGEPLFDDEFLGWEHGPVVRAVYDYYKNASYVKEYVKAMAEEERQYSLEENPDAVQIDSDTHELLTEVYDVFGQKYNYWQLRNQTHYETPWIKATHDGDIVSGNVIDKEEIKKYFEENYIIDE